MMRYRGSDDPQVRFGHFSESRILQSGPEDRVMPYKGLLTINCTIIQLQLLFILTIKCSINCFINCTFFDNETCLKIFLL